jgi:hypothetical protein
VARRVTLIRAVRGVMPTTSSETTPTMPSALAEIIRAVEKWCAGRSDDAGRPALRTAPRSKRPKARTTGMRRSAAAISQRGRVAHHSPVPGAGSGRGRRSRAPASTMSTDMCQR